MLQNPQQLVLAMMTPKNIEDLGSSEPKESVIHFLVCGITNKEESDVYSFDHTLIQKDLLSVCYVLGPPTSLRFKKTAKQLENSSYFMFLLYYFRMLYFLKTLVIGLLC